MGDGCVPGWFGEFFRIHTSTGAPFGNARVPRMGTNRHRMCASAAICPFVLIERELKMSHIFIF